MTAMYTWVVSKRDLHTCEALMRRKKKARINPKNASLKCILKSPRRDCCRCKRHLRRRGEGPGEGAGGEGTREGLIPGRKYDIVISIFPERKYNIVISIHPDVLLFG